MHMIFCFNIGAKDSYQVSLNSSWIPCSYGLMIQQHASSRVSYSATSRDNLLFAYVKTKAQIRCMVAVQLISTFVFATWIVQSLYFLNLKFPASSHLLGCTAWFVSDLVGNPEDRFSCDTDIMFLRKLLI